MKPVTFAILFLVACGDDMKPPVEPIEWEGAYARVTPGFTTEAECRAMNPDPIFACSELLSLCAEGRVDALYTDIVSGGTWTEQDGGQSIRVMLTDAAFSMDGDFVMTIDVEGAISSPEIYGDRAFTRDPQSSLCPGP